MKEFKIVPKVCLDREEDGEKIPATFKGHVVVKVPKFSERQEFRSIAIGLALETDQKIQSIDSLPTLTKLVEKSKEFYVSVEMECLEDGTKFSSYEDLEYDPRCEKIMQEVAMNLSRGIVPGKN